MTRRRRLLLLLGCLTAAAVAVPVAAYGGWHALVAREAATASAGYETVDGTTYKRSGDGERTPVKPALADDFEGARRVGDLFAPGRGWTSMTLLSPKAPLVADYLRLRNRIVRGESDFLDNRVEPSTAVTHGGGTALRTYAVPPSDTMVTSKASLDTELLHLAKGEHVYFSGWFHVSRGRPVSILDFESSAISGSPGLRLLLSEDDRLTPRLELKWGRKPTYRAAPGASLATGRWVNVRLHLLLDDGRNGRMELWLDDHQVIDATGQTLPVADAVYDRLQVGITANPAGVTTELYVDDVELSQEPIF